QRAQRLGAALDAVVTCDTAIAHLAGALGKPTLLLLSSEGEWRWLQNRADTPWYPSLRLLRQPRPGDWAGLAAPTLEWVRGR
ncbi:MAG TPA: glycosyltransferase family 9 protein, partial [Cellvibrionaceae bacterium]|nr:glycosyltransferase family 9 protein [Cellvibrionaceae bacterium]